MSLSRYKKPVTGFRTEELYRLGGTVSTAIVLFSKRRRDMLKPVLPRNCRSARRIRLRLAASPTHVEGRKSGLRLAESRPGASAVAKAMADTAGRDPPSRRRYGGARGRGGAEPGPKGHVAGSVSERRARSALSERAGPDTWPLRRSGKNGVRIGTKEAFSVEVDNMVGILSNPNLGFP